MQLICMKRTADPVGKEGQVAQSTAESKEQQEPGGIFIFQRSKHQTPRAILSDKNQGDAS